MSETLKPAIRFLVIFLLSYVGLSLIYGFWIESFENAPDTLTREVTREVAALVKLSGHETRMQQSQNAPTVLLMDGEKVILEVFEGCNGANVMVVFLSFVFAYGGNSGKRLVIFAVGGLVVIHIINLVRLMWLYSLVFINMRLFHYYHKYVFTAILYLLVFILWWLWIYRWSGLKRQGYEGQ